MPAILAGLSRLIPARAGNTPRALPKFSLTPAHPRSRGEHSCAHDSTKKPYGSSPLARGTPHDPYFWESDQRLIPARAGNTAILAGLSLIMAAHPRSRGEHRFNRLDGFLFFGSSPLARGTHLESRLLVMASRLIPARAGNTIRTHSSSTAHRAHPRSRGEHLPVNIEADTDLGSSPLARGTLKALCSSLAGSGLIPARAGNTALWAGFSIVAGAHPRSRGEHYRLDVARTVNQGSSPLARGTHLLTWGFTPYISKIESLWSQSLTPEYTINSNS